MGSAGGRLVHITPVHSAPTLLQLKTGPIGRGNRCLQPAMEIAEGLCEPSMVPDFQGSHTSEEPPGSDNSHSFSMEGSTLVPCSAGDAIRLPSTVTPLTKPVPADVRHESDGPTTATGHMAYLQEKLGCNNLSESSKELLLAS